MEEFEVEESEAKVELAAGIGSFFQVHFPRTVDSVRWKVNL